LRVEPSQVDQLLHPMIDPHASITVLGTGLPASPGAATGRVVFTADEAVRRSEAGMQVLLVRNETSPEDIRGMYAAQGILTARGGMTSHAAVVARGIGTTCVVGCRELRIHESAGYCHVGEHEIRAGDFLTIDGSSGQVILGRAALIKPEFGGDFAELMSWADGYRTLGVRCNADTPQDAEIARRFGAEGIGLCRTEHMFFAADRIMAVRQLIIAEEPELRAAALEQAKQLAARLRSGEADDPAALGDRFLLERDLGPVSKVAVAASFGREFAAALFALPTGEWSDPIPSGFGLHLVRISEHRDERIPAFDEVRGDVLDRYAAREREAIDEAVYQRLRARYEITVEAPNEAAGHS